MDEKIIKKWRSKLAELIERARASAATADFDARLELADELQRFIMDNPPSIPEQPETAEFEEMDKIARGVHDGLLSSAIDERLAIIAGQTAEFAGLTKKIKAQTDANEKKAKSLRFEKTQRLLASVTETVVAINDLAKVVEEQTGSEEETAALAKQLEKTLAALQDLRDLAEEIV
jgi:hypothetical protein